MATSNNVTLRGFLGNKPTFTETEKSKVSKVSLGWDDQYKKNDEWIKRGTHWYQLVFWGKQAEQAQHLEKGALVEINGKILTTSYEKDGKTHYGFEIRVSSFVEIVNS